MNPARNWGARLHEVTLRGTPAVVLENDLLRITVLLAGSHLVEFNYKRRDLDFAWLTPWSMQGANPDAASDDVASFMDNYPGGWQEIFPSGGAPSAYRGAALAQHAEVAALPWAASVVADTPDEVAVRLTVRTRRLPYAVSKVLRLAAGSATLQVDEEVVNESDQTVHAMWGQHLAYGRPFLRPGCRIRVPDGVRVIPHPEPVNPPRRAVAPGGPYDWPVVPAFDGSTVDLSVAPPAGTPTDVVYLTGFTEGWYEVTDPDAGIGIRADWDAGVLPYLWQWREVGDTTGWPWWGRAYVVGLEPFSSYPTSGLAEAVSNGSALTLGPRATRQLSWSVTVV